MQYESITAELRVDDGIRIRLITPNACVAVVGIEDARALGTELLRLADKADAVTAALGV